MNKIEWEAMQNIDVMTVDPSTLVDIKDVKVNIHLPKTERIVDYVRQVGNPYCYRYDDTVVKSNFPFMGRKLAEIVKSVK